MASNGSAKMPVFPAPPPATVLISAQEDEVEPEMLPTQQSPTSEKKKPRVPQFINVASDGPHNDGKLETLSIHEQEEDENPAADDEEFLKRGGRRRIVSESGIDEAAMAELYELITYSSTDCLNFAIEFSGACFY